MPESCERGALTECVFLIMISLKTPMHGYCIMQHISQISGGRVNLCPGTLYGALNTLLQKKWIESVPGEDSCRRKEYVLTELGKQVLQGELERLKELVKIGSETIIG